MVFIADPRGPVRRAASVTASNDEVTAAAAVLMSFKSASTNKDTEPLQPSKRPRHSEPIPTARSSSKTPPQTENCIMSSPENDILYKKDKLIEKYEMKLADMNMRLQALERHHANCDFNGSRNTTPKRKSKVSSTEDEDVIEGDSENELPLHDVKDMVPIGTGKSMVPRGTYINIDWNSHTMATRKLLVALFPRRVLATHSLTGKASPAFANKPAKLHLDPVKINDIIMTVTENCGVKENLVRNAITSKCADENKMSRMRKAKRKSNKENNPGAADKDY